MWLEIMLKYMQNPIKDDHRSVPRRRITNAENA